MVKNCGKLKAMLFMDGHKRLSIDNSNHNQNEIGKVNFFSTTSMLI